MRIKPFQLERYFAKYEFTAKYLLSSSDCDGLAQQELISWADRELRADWDNLRLGYTESQGLPLLRQEIAKLYQDIQPQDVLVCAPEEAIFLAFNSILSAGDHVVTTYPGYQSLYQVAESIGCTVDHWQADESQGWRFNPEDLQKILRSNTKLIVINFPHNPTGSLPSIKDYRQVLEIARARNITVFSDEMYRFLEHDPALRLPAACEKYDQGISLFGMSKTFGLAGLRIGWLVSKKQTVLKNVLTLKDYTTICNSAPSELLSVMALRAKEKIIARHLARIEQNLTILDQFFVDCGHILAWARPHAGTIGFAKLLLPISSYDFCEQVVKDTGIMLLPSRVYDYDDHHIRIGFGRENVPEVVELLRQYLLKQYPA